MRPLLLTLCALFCLLGAPSAFCDDGPTISGGEGEGLSPRDLPETHCRVIVQGEPKRNEPRMGGGGDAVNDVRVEDSCPGAQVP